MARTSIHELGVQANEAAGEACYAVLARESYVVVHPHSAGEVIRAHVMRWIPKAVEESKRLLDEGFCKAARTAFFGFYHLAGFIAAHEIMDRGL